MAREKPEILFQDHHLYIVNKPPGMLTQKDATDRPSLEEICREILRRETGKKSIFLQPVHRLDRPASGIVLFARSSKALSRLHKAMRDQQIQKTYWARVEGVVAPPEGEWEDWLVHDSFHARVVSPDVPGAKRALLRYRTLKQDASSTLLEVDLLTGRYHQIRVQAAERGHPIVGDGKYGSSCPQEVIALHARQIVFPHPTTKAMMTFAAQEPDLLQK